MKINIGIFSVVKNILYNLASNLFLMLVSAIVTLLVPKFIGIKEFSFWQLYLFYTSYAGYFHFGWNDGFLLKNSGKEYSELDKNSIRSQFLIQSVLMFCASGIIWKLLSSDPSLDNKYIYFMFCLNIIIINLRYLLLSVLQCSSRFKEFAFINVLDRACFMVGLIYIFICNSLSYQAIIIADLVAKLISFFLLMFLLRDIFIGKVIFLKSIFGDIYDNIKIGIKLMLSSLANMLILGIARFKIEKFWDIILFGKVSLCISIVNLFITFINAIGIILFQALFSIKEETLPEFYEIMRNMLLLLMSGMLIFYFPIIKLMEQWLPQYADSFKYMAFLFPMCLFESKIVLLNSALLKMYRLENKLLLINVISVVLSFLFSEISVNIFRNINLTLCSVTLVSFARCCMTNLLIEKKFYNNFFFSLEEGLVAFVFIILASCANPVSGFLEYLALYMVYLIIKRKKICSIICRIRNIIFV